jgi:hypothetical protein
VKPQEEEPGVGREQRDSRAGWRLQRAVLASIFAHYGGCSSSASFVDGLTPAIWVGAVVVAVGARSAAHPRRRRPAEVETLRPVLEEPPERGAPSGQTPRGLSPEGDR